VKISLRFFSWLDILAGGYSGALHSVQTQRDQKEWAISM